MQDVQDVGLIDTLEHNVPDKVMIAGDWHGNGSWAQKAIAHAAKADCQAIVHLGDFGYWVDSWETDKYLAHIGRELFEWGLKLYWVDGNHEDHSRIINEGTDVPGFEEQIIYLPRGFRWTWHDKTWMSVGGAHSVDKWARKEGVSWWPEEHLSESQVEYASRPGAVHVMVCHDCPDGVDIPGINADEKLDVSQSFWPPAEIALAHMHRKKLGRVVDAVRPKVLYHGHYHVFHRGYRGDLPIIGLDMDATTLDRNTMILDLTA